MPTALAPLRLLEALTTPHGVDRYTQLLNPMLTVRELRARVERVERRTATSTTLTLKPTRQWQGFQAGQFVQVGVLIDGRWQTRCFSPANSQHDRAGGIELTVKAQRGGAGGLVSQHLYTQAEPGMVVQLAPAAGTFVLPDERPDHVLLISGGSGITPVLSMLRTLLDEQYPGEITFLHYADSPEANPYLFELHKLASAHKNLRLALHYRARFTPEHLEGADAETFLCGPPGMMDAIKAHYAETDRTDRLHYESFGSATTRTSTTEFVATDTTTTILEQAEAAGLSPEHGCRRGICFSCTAVKKSGCTRNVLTGELNDDPDTEIQICINAPVGDVAMDL